jgi:hypothetical protein
VPAIRLFSPCAGGTECVTRWQAAPFEDQSMLPPPLPTENHNKENTEATKAAMLAMANAGPLSRLLVSQTCSSTRCVCATQYAHTTRDQPPRVSTWLVALLPTACGTNQLLGGWLSVADTVQLERMEWVELAVK